jgi:hypothetical protein
MERFSVQTVAKDGKCLLLSLGILLENDQYEVLQDKVCTVHVQTKKGGAFVHLLRFKLFRIMCGSVLIYENVTKIQRKTGVRGGNVQKITYLLTELSPSSGAANCAATQERPSILWNPKVHYRVHKSLPLILILSHINPIHTIPCYLSKIHFNIVTHSRVGLPSGVFPSGFPNNILYAFFFSLIRATCPAHLVPLDLIILINLGEEYKSKK